ncbi:MAG TPA: MSMEG_1061 family FMN-dependent PPOX-type flavoprotein, partial [Ilumatobacteraceae bacterium]|nr:MSMEG_1061 family FMN-dependent PPOX-type flavoprotein [Ilumatobacteraceae bacterium]
MSQPFTKVIGNDTELRDLYRRPAATTQLKVQPCLDKHARAFIQASPFVLIATTSPDGTGDVSPKGGPPGFVIALDDDHIAVPDLAGNNLLDSISNVVNGSGIGMLFLVPGVDETLRVNGYACITTDDDVLDACAVKDRRPKAAIGVTVTQQYMHCAKAFRRSEL